MIQEALGYVIQQKNSWVDIALPVTTPCRQCHAESSCGVASVSQALPKQEHTVRCETQMNLKPGEQVSVQLPQATLLQAASVAYLYPLAGFFFALLAFKCVVFPNITETQLLFTGLFGGMLGFFLAKHHARKFEDRLQPKIIRVLGQPVSHHIKQIS